VRVAARLSAIAIGEGGVWVTAPGKGESKMDESPTRGEPGSVVRLDSVSGRITGTARVGRRPSELVVGEGRVWVANSDDGTISEIAPESAPRLIRTIKVTSPDPVGAGRLHVAVGYGHAIWVANQNRGMLAHFDVQRGKVTSWRVAVKALPTALPVAITANSKAVWILLQAEDGESALCRVTGVGATHTECSRL
jgi:DNA-binding beta-propeller fold protein YncE